MQTHPITENCRELYEQMCSLRWVHLRCELLFLSPATLPPYKGSTLRGGLLNAFRHRHGGPGDFPSEEEYRRSLYFQLFDVPRGPNITRTTAPWLLHLPLRSKERFQPGDRLSFEMLLWGPHFQHLSLLVEALQEMGEAGLGQNRDQGMGRCLLVGLQVRTTSGWQAIPENRLAFEESHLLQPSAWPDSLQSVAPSDLQPLHLQLDSPVRLKAEDHFVQPKELTPHLMLRAVVRRLRQLTEDWTEHSPGFDQTALLAAAEDSLFDDNRSRWHEWERYSSRHERHSRNHSGRMRLDGLVGKVCSSAFPAVYLPFFKLAESFHIGTGPSLGMGRFTVLETKD